jgi:hypothetical protein
MRDPDEVLVIDLQLRVAAGYLGAARFPEGSRDLRSAHQGAVRAGEYLHAAYEAMDDVFGDYAARPALVAHDLEQVRRLCQMVDELLTECAAHLRAERRTSGADGDPVEYLDATLHSFHRTRSAVQSAARLVLQLRDQGNDGDGATAVMREPAIARLRAAQRDGLQRAVGAHLAGPRR